MIVLVDNYDSFVHNLARYFERLGQPTLVVRNDATDPASILALGATAVVLSPGPCTPAEAGGSLDVVRELTGRLPILGVCLGHQAIAAAFGGKIVRAAEPMHGRTSQVHHRGHGLFAELPSPFTACRYHSLVVDRDSLPACLQITAWTADQTIMALAHQRWPVFGVQFHPESILSEHGYLLLANFLRAAGLDVPDQLPHMASERTEPVLPAMPLPDRPVTF